MKQREKKILTGFEAFKEWTHFGRIHEKRSVATGEVDVGHLGSGSNTLIDPSEVGPNQGVHHVPRHSFQEPLNY